MTRKMGAIASKFNFPNLSQFPDLETTEWRGPSQWGRACKTAVIFSSVSLRMSLKESITIYLGNYALWDEVIKVFKGHWTQCMNMN